LDDPRLPVDALAKRLGERVPPELPLRRLFFAAFHGVILAHHADSPAVQARQTAVPVDPASSLSYLRPVKKLDIITIPDRQLRMKSAPVERVDDATRRFMDDMLATMYAADGLGLAAVQVGLPRRMITIDVARREDENAPPAPIFLINPEILSVSDDTAIYAEGCLSIPEYYADVERPARVRVAYTDREGERKDIEANGILAVCLQHEIDHLNGKLFIDYLSKLKRDMVVKKFTKQAKLGQKVPSL
jgi:peptide deformylase